ncbi:ABC transporter ATP-binding protein [bacterium]|nr:MAG: ABC transporter ATP-binding protein [bacterium]
MLKAQGLLKRFGDHLAVDRVDLTIPQGGCFGLLGPNGAGKTTTISMLVGILKPDAGTVEMDGAPVSKRRIGFVPQELALYEELTAWENLRFFGLLYDLSGKRLEERIGAALAVANLKDRAKDRVESFSGGMKRRLNIAIALLHDPDLIVLDEPTVGVDPQSRNAIFEALEALRGQGKTLLYTTHYMEEVERLCDRIAIMDHGRIVAEGTLAELQRSIPGKRRVTLELESAADSALPALRTLPGVVDVETAEKSLSLDVESLEASLPGILHALAEHNVRYGALASDRLSLEEVFLQKTGRSLRD